MAKSIQFLPALDLGHIFFSAVAKLCRSYERAGKRLCSQRSDGDVYFPPDPNSQWCCSSPSDERNWLCQSHIRMSLRVTHGKSHHHFIKTFSTFMAKSIIGLFLSQLYSENQLFNTSSYSLPTSEHRKSTFGLWYVSGKLSAIETLSDYLFSHRIRTEKIQSFKSLFDLESTFILLIFFALLLVSPRRPRRSIKLWFRTAH